MPEQPAPPAAHEPSAPAPQDLGSRYATARAPRSRRLTVLGVVAGLTVGVLGAAYMAFGSPDAGVRGKDVGFSVTSSESVTITFDVAKPADSTVVCTLNALNTNYAQVGTRDVTIGPSDKGEARYTTQIATTELAVTAVVEACDLLD